VDVSIYLKETSFFDFSNEQLQAFAREATQDLDTGLEKAVALYYKVRDHWKYNPYNISFDVSSYKASNLFQKESGHCIDKAILMTTLCRAIGIPARLRFAKVKNHIATEQFEEYLKTNEMVPHGIVEVYLNEEWVKSTPAFNKQLCERLQVKPLEFDGKTDSLFQEYDKKGNVFMTYVEDYGHFEDVPLDFIYDIMKQHYPHIFEDKELQKIFQNPE